MNETSKYRFVVHDPQGVKQHALTSDAIDTLLRQLYATDWRCEMRFICLECDHGPALGETSWVPEFLGYLNLFGHPRGVFVEAIEPRAPGDRDAPVPYCPIRSGDRQTMARIWVGLGYRRVPLEYMVEANEVSSIVRHYLEHRGERLPTIQWQREETIDWEFHLSPEDDWFDPAEPETRPASQVSPSKEVLLDRLLASYRLCDLDPNWITLPFGGDPPRS